MYKLPLGFLELRRSRDGDGCRIFRLDRLGGRVWEARLLDGKNAVYLNRHLVRQRNRSDRGADVAPAVVEHFEH